MANEEHLTWEEFGKMIDTLAEGAKQIHAINKIDRIVGVSRGGLPIGVALSHQLEVPFTPVEVSSYNENREQGSIQCNTPEEVLARCTGHVLLVDDLADSGKTSDFLMGRLKELTQPEITLATLYYKPTSIIRPDLFVKETSNWVIFPWGD